MHTAKLYRITRKYIVPSLLTFYLIKILYCKFGCRFWNSKMFNFNSDDQVWSKFIIDTPGCKIPRTSIIPDYYKTKWHLEFIPDCSYEQLLGYLDDEKQILTLNPEWMYTDCCLHQIKRRTNQDNDFSLSKCRRIQKSFHVRGKEILVIKCRSALNFFVNIPIKQNVKQKLHFWKYIPPTQKPPNVLVFGIDTVSRSHAFRSLPRTMELFKKLGFSDFKGFHSLAPSTLPNFMGLLMGLSQEEVRDGAIGGCAPDWESTYDGCPFIWKEFGLGNYVTVYLEDGGGVGGTFNWGGQGGFREPPTDYYIRPVFQAIKELRGKYAPRPNDEEIDCTSSETVPQFMIRYIQRFLHKFKDVPTFSLLWLDDPFHDNQFTLGSIDKDISEFFQSLSSLPSFHENTIVIFLSDHGDRYSFFQTESMEGWIERGLPPLFIRFPNIYKKQFPNLDQILKENTQRLITPFDLHDTLKHALSLNDEKMFQDQILEDRQTLLFPVPTNRTCESLHLKSGLCLCGASINQESDSSSNQNPFYLSTVINFVRDQLNTLISLSKYSQVCAKWETNIENILSFRVLRKSENSTDYMIQFMAYPREANFEVNVRVVHVFDEDGECELIGEFHRVNSYGNESYCVGYETDEDKLMKELCSCQN